MTSTYEQLCAILIQDYQLVPQSLSLDAPLEALGIDSLGVAELLFNIEDEFKIAVPPDSVELTTIGDVVEFIDQLVAAQHGAGAMSVDLPEPVLQAS